MSSEWRVKGDEEDRDGRTVKTDLVGMGGQWRMTVRDGGVETAVKREQWQKEKENKNQQPVSMQPSPRTSGVKGKAT